MTPPPPRRRHLPNSPFAPDPEPVIEDFSVGDRVTHDLYGLGKVTSVEESAVTVDFAGKPVRVLSPYTKLTAL